MPVATAISVYVYPMQAGSPCATVFGLVGVPCVPRYVVILGEVLTYPPPWLLTEAPLSSVLL